MKKVYIETYGCQMNVADTEVVFSILGKAGYGRAEQIADADVIMANTCSIRDNAEQRILGRIEQFNIWRKARPGVVTGILGCMAERLKDELLNTGKVDIVAGPDSYRRLPSMIEEALCGRPQIDVLLSREETYADIDPVRMDKNGVSAFISIMRGCNNVCSYCVVPYTRGAERSRDWKSIVREACDCFSRGYREVTLLGQNVDSYNYGGTDFAALLKTVAEAVPNMPIVLYNIPARTGNALEPETVVELAKIDNIVGAKDSSGNWDNLSAYIDLTKDMDFGVLSGNDALILKALRRGAKGAIAGCANVYPKNMVGIYENWAQGDDEAAEVCQAAVAPLRDCFKYGNPNTVVKTAVNLLGYPVGTCRAPFNYLPDEGLEALRATLESDRKRGVR